MDLVVEIYRISSLLPKDEAFGLVTQMRRAAVSIPSNLAEGSARSTTRELIQFVSIALGSASELDAQLEVIRRLNLIESVDGAQEKLDRVSEQLAAMRAALRAKARS